MRSRPTIPDLPPRVVMRSIRAFSLVETTMVIAILGVVTAIGLPRYAKSLARYRVDAAVERLANDIQTLRQRAMDQSVTATITLDASADTLSASGVGGSSHSASLYTTDFSQDPFGVDLILGTSPTVFTFNGHGRSDQIVVATVTKGSYSKVVVITTPSGEVIR